MSATNLGSIFWRVDADTTGAVNSTNQLATSATRTTGVLTKLSKVASGISVGLLVRKLVSVQREFDRLNAAVLTSTGGIEKAAVAFEAIERFAAETPYALQQSVKAFTQLVNLGLTPSEEAMRSYGDTASALGKDLNQMIEAVADAATGEFERLKEFGIKSKNQGDTIQFTFQGVKKTVKNNAADIEGYLIKLGQNKFAGAMANRMATLDGKISNLNDTWDKLFRSVSSQGAGTVMASGVTTAIDAIQGLIDMIESGQLDGVIQTVANAWRVSFGNIANDISTLTDFMLKEFNIQQKAGESVPGFISDAFFQFPANIKAVIQIATVELLAFVDKAKAVAKQLNIDLNPFADADEGTYEADLIKIEKNRLSVISSILAERDKAIKSVNTEREEVDRNTIAWKKNEEAKRKAAKGKDALAGFKVKPDADEDALVGPEMPKKVKLERDQEQKLKQETAITTTESIISRGETPEEKREAEKVLLKKWRDEELINAQQFSDAKTQIDQEGAAAREQIAAMALGSFANSFGQLAGVLKNSEGEQSSAYKAMFALSKGFAVATAGVNMALAISEATKLPWPANLPAIATATAQGASLVGTIAGATYSGRENGGSVIGGQTYEVGEKNKPELLMIPGNNGKVLSNSEMKGLASGGSGGGGVTVNLYGAPSDTRVESRQDPLTREQVVDIVVGQMGSSNSQGQRAQQRVTNVSNTLNGQRRRS